MKPQRSITIKDSIIISGRDYKGTEYKDLSEYKSCMREAEQGIELLRKLKLAIEEDTAGYHQIELMRIGSMPDYVSKDIRDIKEKITPVSDELKELRGSVDRLAASINELPNKQEYLNIIQRDLKEIKDYMPEMKGQIDEVLSQLKSPSSTMTQKLEIVLPIIPQIVSYKVEADVPKLVADIKQELKSLVLRIK